MTAKMILCALAVTALASPVLAASYPISGAWGESKTSGNDKVDCTKVRVMDFRGEQRTDTGGSVHAYKNVSVTPSGSNAWKVADTFANGQIRNARVIYTLKKIGDDRLELALDKGGTIKLQRCGKK
ncbi:MAG: hypothetical protein JOZ70_06365 [Pseudolabrys sp.]|nr:hypothetical protein [Pseudolabrys sp.]